MDDRLVSDLLETTVGNEANNGGDNSKLSAKV